MNERTEAYILTWLNEVEQMLKSISSDFLGYKPTGNCINQTPQFRNVTVGKLPSEMQVFYGFCDGVDMPDVHVGYFIHSLSWIEKSHLKGEPFRIASYPHEIVVFGSDGGGGRFALGGETSQEILYLPSSGGIHNGVFRYLSKSEAPYRVAKDWMQFMEVLRSDLRAFLLRDETWKFMID
ncbi:MAG: hypothetical protein J7619_13475 [Dyadobacter sp.]|uniref:hypothetical protein n=1 Tax=Dyadobacter sp. TaxID=1914288 RepID=UPI001B0B20DB|nr:hypothetical protein [Dyadobacter sp.]MBO9613705.1 hypothetical protein [Dyadobacter sp.]